MDGERFKKGLQIRREALVSGRLNKTPAAAAEFTKPLPELAPEDG